MAENISMHHQIKKKGDIIHGSIYIRLQRRITQHKRFVPYGSQPKFYYAKTSFTPKLLYNRTYNRITKFSINKYLPYPQT